MATTQISTISDTLIWVLACSEKEDCEIQSINGDMATVEYPTLPINITDDIKIISKNQKLHKFSGNGFDKLWVLIDKDSLVVRRPLITNTTTTIVDSGGRSNTIGTFGEQWATDIHNDILVQFSYGKSTRDLKDDITTGSGVVTIQDDNLLAVSSGIDINSLAEIESLNSIRYRAGHTAIAQFTALFTNPLALNTHQRIGVGDGVNGFGIGFDDGMFSITLVRAGVPTYITEFNGSIDIENIDFTKLNLFRITYGYLGIAPISFEIMPKDENSFAPIHTIRLQGKITQTHIQLPYLPIKMRVMSENNTEDVQIRTGSWQGGTFGLDTDSGNRPFGYPLLPGSQVKLDIGITPTPLFAFRSKTTFQGFLNKIRAKLQLFNFLAFDGEGLVTLQFVTGATINGVEGVDYTFTDIDPINSIMEISTDLLGFTGGRVGLTLYDFPTTSGSKITYTPTEIDMEDLGLFIDPSQINIVVANISVGTTDIAWSVNWAELF